jgi:hypothetical protein
VSVNPLTLLPGQAFRFTRVPFPDDLTFLPNCLGYMYRLRLNRWYSLCPHSVFVSISQSSRTRFVTTHLSPFQKSCCEFSVVVYEMDGGNPTSPVSPLAPYPPLQPTEARSRAPEFYGFVAWTSTYLLFCFFLLWALLPDAYIIWLGVSWYPNR